jgi:beta-glucanase (GH16 family)
MMENVPELGPARIRSTIHGEGFSGGNGVRGDFVLPAGTRIDDGFHTYGVSWSPGRLAFYVDDPGKPFFIATPESIPPGTKWIGERPYFLILNLAVGGGWPKSPDETTPSPARMIVDWVRVY